MKIKIVIPTVLLCGALFANHAFAADSHKKHEATQAELKAQAKVTEDQAKATALAKAPKGGTVKACELEEEKGVLIWSVDVATPGTKDVTEVAVDAKTGAVVSVATETPADEAKEAKQEKKEHKKEHKKDKKDEEKDDDDKMK